MRTPSKPEAKNATAWRLTGIGVARNGTEAELDSSTSNHVWTFGSGEAGCHALSGTGSSALALHPSPRVPVLLHEARPNLLAASRTCSDELLRHGFKEWGGIRRAHAYGAGSSLRQVLACHVDRSRAGADLPIVLTRDRRQLASAIEQLALPGTLVTVLCRAVHHRDLLAARNLGLGFLTQIAGLGVQVLRTSRSPFIVEPRGPCDGRWRPVVADRLVADMQAACFRQWPQQLVLLVDLDDLDLFAAGARDAPDASLVAAALRFMQDVAMPAAVILHSARSPARATEGQLGDWARHLGTCLFRER